MQNNTWSGATLDISLNIYIESHLMVLLVDVIEISESYDIMKTKIYDIYACMHICVCSKKSRWAILYRLWRIGNYCAQSFESICSSSRGSHIWCTYCVCTVFDDYRC